ncbi:hypothetical protein O181_069435 [Austropuccinia psidii MF-1]|uniref:Uncharacterized protein n=1 Tax=Austropuccinia psidii MF-1 TaxID=1389203 RepID=A0A9Q3I833_9BASI|nr:hypothetical protein [Austropuccinia psidii MF-1]
MLVENVSSNLKSNTSIVLSIQHTFAMFKKLNIEADELEGLIVQVSCHAPPSLNQEASDQLITAAILSKGNEKPSPTFVGQVIINASQRQEDKPCVSSPFVYWVSDTQDPTPFFPKPSTPQSSCPMLTQGDVC